MSTIHLICLHEVIDASERCVVAVYTDNGEKGFLCFGAFIYIALLVIPLWFMA